MRGWAVLLLFCACGGGPAEWDLGEIELVLAQVPSNAQCIRSVFTGAARTVTLQIDATPGDAASWTVSGLPTGEVGFASSAYAVRCEALGPLAQPSWFSLPQVVLITPDATASLSMTMYH